MKDLWDPMGLALLLVILAPNLLFALTHREGFANAVSRPRLERWEQAGRFGSLAFLVLRLPFLPGGAWFSGGETLSLGLSAALAGLYCLGWALFWREDSLRKSLTLSILPSLLFLERGILTGNWPLTLFALLFAPCHIALSAGNALARRKETAL